MVTLPQRLKRVRAKLGETQTEFGKRFGVDQSTVAKWERGKQVPTDHRIDLIADLEEETNTSDEADENIAGGSKSLFTLVPVTGDVGAGAAVYPVQGETSTRAAGYVKAARGFGAVEALRVRGDSMWPAYRDGDLIFIENRPAELPLLSGKEYIVELADGRVLLKIIELTDQGRYNLISYNAPPENSVEIVAARRVRYIRKA